MTTNWGDGVVTTDKATARRTRRSTSGIACAKPGTYTISMTSRITNGSCLTGTFTKQHTALPAPTKAECEARFGWHLGRNYMYSMKPVGELRRRTSAGSLTVDRTMDFDSMYSCNDFVDANGVVWELSSQRPVSPSPARGRCGAAARPTGVQEVRRGGLSRWKFRGHPDAERMDRVWAGLLRGRTQLSRRTGW
ncbi:MAG: hypothetical protein R2715_21840 [Ilumatobacteraceae bacterium]